MGEGGEGKSWRNREGLGCERRAEGGSGSLLVEVERLG